MKAQIIEVGPAKEKWLTWYCPGCRCDHGVPVPPSPRAWVWDGSLSAPTLAPSFIVSSGHFSAGHSGPCWCTYKSEDGSPPPYRCERCHCYVQHGQIQFLADCTHDFAGVTVEMNDDR